MLWSHTIAWDCTDLYCICNCWFCSKLCSLWAQTVLDLLTCSLFVTSLPVQASSLPLWSLGWASTRPVCSGARSVGRREPACSTTMCHTGTCTSASPSSSNLRPLSCTPPRGSAWGRTTGSTLRTARATWRPPNSSPPTWLWTIWARSSRRIQPTGQSSYTTWRIRSHVTTWSPFYSGDLQIDSSSY